MDGPGVFAYTATFRPTAARSGPGRGTDGPAQPQDALPGVAMPVSIRLFGAILLAGLAFAHAGKAGGAPAAADAWLQVANQLSGGTDFTPHGTQPGLSYRLWPSDDCAGCHGASLGDSSASFRPHPTWAGSMMANAMRDPLFLAALDVANNDVPGVGDYCLRCHTSEGWYGGRVVKPGFGDPPDGSGLGAAACLLGGSYDAPDGYSDYGGLGCHYCHRSMPQGPNGEPLPGNGAVWLDDSDCNGAGEPCRYGPYSYGAGGPQAPHPWKQSAFVSDSAMCGQCHDVSTPDTGHGPLKTLRLADGTDTGVPFPIERTYSEWQRSAFSAPGGTTCQGCHMPMSEDPAASACTLGGFPNRSGDLRVHAFAGGNTWIPAVIRGEYSDTSAIPGSWGGIGRQQSFAQTIEWARQMLLSAATVDARITGFTAPAAAAAGSLALEVTVTNHSGHKLPSGYGEGRRMWLNLEVRDRFGNHVAGSAAYDTASAVLDRDAQARVYEVLQGIWNHNGNGTCDVTDGAGLPMFHFALNDCIAKDNRIPPLGFRPATATDPEGHEVRPVGAEYPETAAGSGTLVNFDTVPYAFTLPAGATGPFTATARLYYQTASRDYIEFLRREAVDQGIPAENDMCAGASNRPFVVGPQQRTRGEYMYQLWNNAADDPLQPGYGKSPPELMAFASTGTDGIFADGFEGAPAGR